MLCIHIYVNDVITAVNIPESEVMSLWDAVGSALCLMVKDATIGTKCWKTPESQSPNGTRCLSTFPFQHL